MTYLEDSSASSLNRALTKRVPKHIFNGISHPLLECGGKEIGSRRLLCYELLARKTELA